MNPFLESQPLRQLSIISFENLPLSLEFEFGTLYLSSSGHSQSYDFIFTIYLQSVL